MVKASAVSAARQRTSTRRGGVMVGRWKVSEVRLRETYSPKRVRQNVNGCHDATQRTLPPSCQRKRSFHSRFQSSSQAMATMSDDDSETMSSFPTMMALVIMNRPTAVADVSHCVELAHVPRPFPPKRASPLLVMVEAASLQNEDLYTAIGRRPLLSVNPTPTKPVTLGIEFTGQVMSSTNKAYKQGDAVMGLMTPIRVRHGCWAQYVTVSSKNVALVPKEWTREQAAAFPMSCLVAQAAADCIQDASQQRVAVVGASGGIGSILVRLLAARGAHVVGVCSERNAEFVKSCGVKEVCTRESGGLATYCTHQESADNMPLDYVLDCVGGDVVQEQASKALRRGGHFVSVVGPGQSFGDSDSSAGVGRGAAIAAKTLKAKLRGTYSYTLASMSPFGMGEKIASIAREIDKSTNGKGPTLRTRTVPANDMIAVRSALDSVAKHESNGRVILDFSVLSDEYL